MNTRCRERECGADTGKPHAKYCDAHRWRHRGKTAIYVLTPEREAYLRAHYDPLERRVSHRIARALSVPPWRVRRWAVELGLAKPFDRNPNWTPEEDVFLEEHMGTRHVNWIAKKLKRSITAVVVRSKRLSISRRAARTWYTAQQVADGFGIDVHVVTRWIASSKLLATREGRDHEDGRPAAWRIEHDAVRQFIRLNPATFSLAKVEQVWFLDIVFNGLTEAKAVVLPDGRYAQFARFVSLQRLIAGRMACDVDGLAAALGVSTRTVRRDLAALRAAGEHVPPLSAQEGAA